MATIRLYRTDLSSFATALSAVANTVPVAPTAATADTTNPQQAAVYPTDAAGNYFIVRGFGLSYSATGLLTGGIVDSIECYNASVAGGSFAVFSGFDAQVFTLLAAATQPNPAATIFSDRNSITADTASLTAPGGDDIITVGGTMPSRIDGGGGINTAVFNVFRPGAAVSGGGGGEAVTVAGITASLVSVQRLEFIDGSVIESPSTPQGQAVLAFQAIFGRLPDPINVGGYGFSATQYGVLSASAQMLATPEGQAKTASLDNGQFVTRIYQNVLRRAPSATELAAARGSLDSNKQTRAGEVLAVVTSPEAATANAGVFANSGVFAASPGAVDTLRAYEVMLGRLPEASALSANAAALDQFYANQFANNVPSEALPDLYLSIQSSAEFAARATPNPYGITAGSSFGAVYAATHSDALTTTNLALVTATAGVSHLPG